mmetsp:Transcript_9445/g.43013  ORF Transcript_9445/g.43013 Transcript_9445/m.43013 type:complete len:294 (+) Transcript_9445:136-1017(+)
MFRNSLKNHARRSIIPGALLFFFWLNSTFDRYASNHEEPDRRDYSLSAIHFLTFASRSYDLTKLKEEASLMKFASTRFCDERCLQGTAFWREHGSFIEHNQRGFGYWIWKYWLVLDLLERLPDGGIILYVDGGCKLNYDGMKRLAEYPDIARRHRGLLLFELNLQERWYTKIDTGMRILPKRRPENWGKQRMATAFLLIKSRRTVAFFTEALRVACEEGYRYIDDTPSNSREVPDFREHRHDQSITSMLSKKYGFAAIPDETYPTPRCYRKGFPIIASRRKIKVSRNNYRPSV